MPVHPIDFQIQANIYSTPELTDIFEESARFQRWLDFEAALALTQAELGIIPQEAAVEIADKAHLKAIDLEAVRQAYTSSRNSLMPVIEGLRNACVDGWGEFVHYGVTTQDVLDTGQILELRAIIRILYRDLQILEEILVQLAGEHKHTVMIGRTHGQQALPITFGLKVSVWLSEMHRHLARLLKLAPQLSIGQLSGAVGSMAALGPQGEEVAKRTLARLGLSTSPIPWHNSRDMIAETGCCFALISTTCEKIANEIFSLGKTEIDELREPAPQRVASSSTMPHKRNPVLCQRVAVMARHVRSLSSVMVESMAHEHERDARCLWAEWLAVPQISIYTGTILHYMREVLERLEVNTEAMARNLHLQKDKVASEWLLFRLAPSFGKMKTQKKLRQLFAEHENNGKSMTDILAADPELGGLLAEEDFIALAQPEKYIGRAVAEVDALLLEIKGKQRDNPKEIFS